MLERPIECNIYRLEKWCYASWHNNGVDLPVSIFRCPRADLMQSVRCTVQEFHTSSHLGKQPIRKQHLIQSMHSSSSMYPFWRFQLHLEHGHQKPRFWDLCIFENNQRIQFSASGRNTKDHCEAPLFTSTGFTWIGDVPLKSRILDVSMSKLRGVLSMLYISLRSYWFSSRVFIT